MKTEEDALYSPLCTDIKPSVALPKREAAEYETADDVKPCSEAATSDFTDTHDGQVNLPPSQESTASTKPTHCLREYLRLLSQDYVCECEFCKRKPVANSNTAEIVEKNYEDSKKEINFEGININKTLQNKLISDRIHQCDLCEYITNRLYNLNKHKITHTKEMRYKCKVCNFMTSSSHFYARHKKEHAIEKSYACEWCDYKTNNRSCLNEHKKTHNNILRTCNLCEFKTKHRSSFLKHKKSHIVGKPFACHQCDFRTRFKSFLLRHKKKTHE